VIDLVTRIPQLLRVLNLVTSAAHVLGVLVATVTRILKKCFGLSHNCGTYNSSFRFSHKGSTDMSLKFSHKCSMCIGSFSRTISRILKRILDLVTRVSQIIGV